jgi:hypothetical protein
VLLIPLLWLKNISKFIKTCKNKFQFNSIYNYNTKAKK